MQRRSERTELERLVARSRLIGADPTLVLHGGGNTSTKLVETDHLGRERRVMRIKGSGSDLATATARRLPRALARRPAAAARARGDDRRGDGRLPRALPRRAGRAAALDRDAAARVPAGGARRPRPRRRDLLARERARSRRRRCTRRSATTSRSCRTCGPGSSSRSASPTSPDARAVVLAHHGLVTWGDTHEESYELTLELVERAREYLGGARRRAGAAASRTAAMRRELPRAASRAALARAAQVLATDRSQRALADRPDVGADRGDAQHARPHAPDRRAHLRDRARRRHGGSHGVRVAPVVPRPAASARVAAGPDSRAARMRARARRPHPRLGGRDPRPLRRRELAQPRARSTTSRAGRSSCTS